jgi:hypothetical protein
VQAVVDFGVYGDRKFLRHPGLQYVLEYDDGLEMQSMAGDLGGGLGASRRIRRRFRLSWRRPGADQP